MARKHYDLEGVAALQREGQRLAEPAAAALERHVREEPDDLEARLRLIGFSKGSAKHEHVLHLIRKFPWIPLSPLGTILRADDKSVYQQGKALWLANVAESPEDLQIVENAARYFLLSEPVIGRDCYRWAQERGFDSWYAEGRYCEDWLTTSPSDVRNAGQAAREAYRQALKSARDSGERLAVLHSLRDCAARMADENARGLYRIAYRIAKDDWPESPLVAYGLAALAEGDPEAAGNALSASIATTRAGGVNLRRLASPTLAAELLGRGHREAVLRYLNLCAAEFPPVASRLSAAAAAIAAGDSRVLLSIFEATPHD